MSKKYLQIQIPTPCSEDFSKMTPVEKGHFCGSCEKVVIDFSKMSDREIVDFYKKNKGKICGRFHKSQLNRNIQMTPPKVNSFLGKAASLLLTGVLSAGAMNVTAQSLEISTPNSCIELLNECSNSEIDERRTDNTKGRIFRIKIIGEKWYSTNSNLEVQGAVVKLRKTDLVAISDSLGIAEFILPEELLGKKKLTFDITHHNYIKGKVKIKTKKIRQVTVVQLSLKTDPAIHIAGFSGFFEVVPPPPHESFPVPNGTVNHFEFEEEHLVKQELVQKNKSLPHEEEESIFPPIGVAIKKVYPNPFIDEINLEISTEQEGNIKIQLVDISGQVVFQKEEFIDRGTQEYTLYVGNLSLAGNLFILQVQDESGQMQSQQMMRFTNHGFTFR